MKHMKKIHLLILTLFIGFSALGQQTYFTTAPSGSNSLVGLQYRYKALTPDSLNQLFMFWNGKYNQVYTATEANLRFAPISGGGGYVPSSRIISTNAGTFLFGGGNLGSNLSLYNDTAGLTTKIFFNTRIGYATQAAIDTKAPLSGGSGYIWNQDASAQVANFWIRGSGVISDGDGRDTYINGHSISFGGTEGGSINAGGFGFYNTDGGGSIREDGISFAPIIGPSGSFKSISDTVARVSSDQQLELTGTHVFTDVVPTNANDLTRLSEITTLRDSTYNINENGYDILNKSTFRNNLDVYSKSTIDGNFFKLTGGNQSIGYQNFSLTAPIPALAIIHVGNRNVLNSTAAQILVGGTYDNSVGVNGHAFADNSNLSKTGTWAYAGYDGRVDITGTGVTADHYVSFQHGPTYNFTGTIDKNYGAFTTTAISAGTITGNYGYYAANPNKTGSGVITNNYGVYIENQTAGTNNWSIYSAGGYNYFGGSMEVNGTQYLQNVGQQLRLKADGTTLLDGGLYVNAAGLTVFGNWDQTRGFATKASGDGYYFGGKFGIGIATPAEALDVVGNGKFSGAIIAANIAAGTAGNDSLVVHDNATDEFRRISPTYYATSASIPTNYWTTNSTQTGLTGDKTSTGTHTVGTMNTTNASGIKIFNVTGANSEYLEGSWSANTVSFQTKATGTGTVRNTIWGTANRVFNIADMPTTLGFYQFTAGTINPTGAVGTLWSGTWSASSGSTNNVAIGPTYNQSGTASYNAFLISPYEQTTGSGAKYLANFGTNTAAFAGGTHTRLFSVLNTGQIFSNTLTASTALVSDASKNIVSSSVTSTEMALLSGKTSLQSAITLTSFYADATATGSAADAYNYTLAANSLTANGQYIEGEYVGNFGGGGGTGSQIVLSFGGTTIYDTGPFLGTGTNPITYTFYRTGTSTARCTITYVSTGGFPVSTTADLTGLNFTTTNVIKASIVTSVGSTLTMKAAKLLIYK